MIEINFQKPLKCQDLNRSVLKKEPKWKFFQPEGYSERQIVRTLQIIKNGMHYCFQRHAETGANIDRKKNLGSSE